MSESNSRAEIVEVMAEALCFVGEACDCHCPDVDHRPCPDALYSWGKDAERILGHLEAAGMAVVPREPTARMIIAGASAKPFANRMNTLTAAGVWSAMLAALPPRSE